MLTSWGIEFARARQGLLECADFEFRSALRDEFQVCVVRCDLLVRKRGMAVGRSGAMAVERGIAGGARMRRSRCAGWQFGQELRIGLRNEARRGVWVVWRCGRGGVAVVRMVGIVRGTGEPRRGG